MKKEIAELKIMSTIANILCAFLICLMPAKANSPDNAIRLKYTLNSGEEYMYSQRTSMKQSVGDTEISTSIEAGNDITIRIKEAKERKYKLETIFTPLKISISGFEQTGVPDTTMRVDIPQSASALMVIGEDGTITEEEISNGDKGNVANIAGSLSSATWRQAVKQTLKNILSPLPSRSISIGDEWTRETSENGATPDVKITMKWKYKLKDIVDTLGKRCAVITAKTTSVTMEGSINQMGMTMHVEGDGAASGNTIVEIANGMAIAGKMDMQIEMRMAMSGQDQMIVPVSMETVNVFTRKMK